MINNGFIRVASITTPLKVADTEFNTTEIINAIYEANNNNCHLAVFPELAITGYTCQDLFFQKTLIDASKNALITIKNISKELETAIIIGLPLSINHSLYNCAAFIVKGQILGIIPKTFLPNYNEFYEKRWFKSDTDLIDEEIIIDGEIIPISSHLIFTHQSIDTFRIGIEICEDLWTPIAPSTLLSLNGATIIANLSASNELVGKSNYRKSLVSNQSAKTITGYIYTSAGYGESTNDLVYGGHCLIYENGHLLAESERFKLSTNITYADVDIDRLSADRHKMNTYSEVLSHIHTKDFRELYFNTDIQTIDINRNVDPYPFVPSNLDDRNIRCKEIFNIQTSALAKRLSHIGCQKAIIGISGGLDSTLALLVTVKTFDLLSIDRKNIIAVTMPGFGTTDRTYNNAITLINNLGVTMREISIK